MNKQNIFVKKFTYIEALQTAKECIYSIISSEGALPYGIEITEQYNTDTNTESALHLFSKLDCAKALAVFLNEQNVAPAQLHDVLHDLKIQGALK